MGAIEIMDEEEKEVDKMIYTLEDLTHDELITFTTELVGELEIHKKYMGIREESIEQLRIRRSNSTSPEELEETSLDSGFAVAAIGINIGLREELQNRGHCGFGRG